jgi:glycosyltransferase involved in cell wall biosynthesis
VLSPVDLRHAAHNRLHDLIRELSKRHEIDSITTYAWWLDSDEGASYESECHDCFLKEIMSRTRVEYLANTRENPITQEILAPLRYRELLARLNNKSYDVIFNYNTILSGLLLSHRLSRTPMVYDLADDIAVMAADSRMTPKAARSLVGPIGTTMVRAACRRSSLVTVATPRLSRTYGVPNSKIRVVPNGVDTLLFKPGNMEEAKAKFGVQGKTVIGYVGVLREWVDIDGMLQALRILKEYPINPCLMIVGGEGRLSEFMSRAKTLNLESRVVFVGTLPYARVPEAMAAMDVGLIPFRPTTVGMNALPLKLFEYMACGVPVVSQRIGPVVDAVGDRIIYASDGAELAGGIYEVISSPNETQCRKEDGLTLVRANWNWESIGSRLDDILRDAAKMT